MLERCPSQRMSMGRTTKQLYNKRHANNSRFFCDEEIILLHTL